MITVTKEGISRAVSLKRLEEYTLAGWTQEQSKVSKKKKAEKPAETAPEAAQEDQGNANQGE